MQKKQSHYANRYIIYDSAVVGEINEHIFNPESHQEKGSLKGQALGRGTTYFIDVNGTQCVLRHYRRGGMVAKLLRDQYIWAGIQSTRAWREWDLLEHMLTMGLPAPAPVAARVVRKRFYYCADLITRRIENTQVLSAILQLSSIPEEIWQKIGATIKRFHSAGIYHADLNAQNILINSENQVFLIDFDKGCLRNPHSSWQHQNLKRLLRSLKKAQQIFTAFHFTEQDWQALMDGYQNS